MDLWHLILFAAASIFALRSFVALTNHHQRYTLQRLLHEHRQSQGDSVAAPSGSKLVA